MSNNIADFFMNHCIYTGNINDICGLENLFNEYIDWIYAQSGQIEIATLQTFKMYILDNYTDLENECIIPRLKYFNYPLVYQN